MILVLLESPYAGNVELNVTYARACMRDCLKRGEAPFASHLLYTQPGVLDDLVPNERAPFSPDGKRCDVHHYRLFLAPDWRTPILPRKELYSREFTEAGWKSWSDQHPPEAFGEAPP